MMGVVHNGGDTHSVGAVCRDQEVELLAQLLVTSVADDRPSRIFFRVHNSTHRRRVEEAAELKTCGGIGAEHPWQRVRWAPFVADRFCERVRLSDDVEPQT